MGKKHLRNSRGKGGKTVGRAKDSDTCVPFSNALNSLLSSIYPKWQQQQETFFPTSFLPPVVFPISPI
jgi:hypothetical protein